MPEPTGPPIPVKVTCPYCGHLSRTGAQAQGQAQEQPSDGALMVCAYCAHVARLRHGPLGLLSLPLSDDELAEAMADPGVSAAVLMPRSGMPSGDVVAALRGEPHVRRSAGYDCPN